MKKRIQVLLIHGGATFKSRRGYLHYLKTREITVGKQTTWVGDYLRESLGGRFEVIRLHMPLLENARYSDWKIHFERHLPYLKDDLVMVGFCLGAVFLAKYLSENRFPRRIRAVYLVGAPFDDTLPDDDLTGGFRLGRDLSGLDDGPKRLCMIFSKDDDVVPLSHAEKYRKKLKNAEILICENKHGHFEVPELPEIVDMIKRDTRGSPR